MALPLKPGLTPAEVAFLCEMELVRIVPEERMPGFDLLSGQIPAFNPPFPAKVPLWLALLLKRQRKARLVPPAWLSTDVLSRILDTELEESGEAFSPAPSLPPGRYLPSDDPEARLEFSPPFIPTNAEAGFLSYHKHISTDTEQALDETKLLPYHWMELAHLFLTHAADNIYNPDAVRRLVRDLKEARSAKIRRGTSVLDAGSGVKMNGVGAMEIAEARTFITGVVDGLRKIGASREQARKEDADENDAGDALGRDRDGDDRDAFDDDDAL